MHKLIGRVDNSDLDVPRRVRGIQFDLYPRSKLVYQARSLDPANKSRDVGLRSLNCQQTLINVVLGVVISGLGTSLATAQELFVKLTVACPSIGTKGSKAVMNLGNFLAGNGSIKLEDGEPERSLFEGPIIQGANIPKNISESGYQNFGVSYNPSNGAVTCYYQSNQGFDPFSLGHVYVNSLGGVSVSSTSNVIRFKIPVGLD